ncbi:hypothetical protein PtB15_10B573 [Puccinia triticina]|nr:hypothetical protein PtB15_10B573 [Puccinia triticina]
MAVHNRTLYYAAGLNKTAGEWLLSKFALADDIIKTARIALDALNQLSNPHSVTAGTYTDNFFQQKWEDKRAYHLETTQSYQEKQKKELGQLLCLEEQLETKWQLEYNKLLKLEAEDAFWNNGLFTNRNEPWAVNPITQKGICHLAAFNRGLEKEHCLGWEWQQLRVDQASGTSHPSNPCCPPNSTITRCSKKDDSGKIVVAI